MHVAPMFDETFDGLQDLGVAPMIWSPLAGGRLFSGTDAQCRKPAPGDQGHRRPAAASRSPAWCSPGSCSCQAGRLPLTGSGRIEAVAVAVAGTAFTLSRTDWFTILRAARGPRGRVTRSACMSDSSLKIVEGKALSAQQKKDLLNRLARIEGQLRGVQKLIALAGAAVRLRCGGPANGGRAQGAGPLVRPAADQQYREPERERAGPGASPGQRDPPGGNARPVCLTVWLHRY